MAETPVGDPPIRASAWRCCRATADLGCVCHVGGRTRGAFSSRHALAPAWGSCNGGLPAWDTHPSRRGADGYARKRRPDGTPTRVAPRLDRQEWVSHLLPRKSGCPICYQDPNVGKGGRRDRNDASPDMAARQRAGIPEWWDDGGVVVTPSCANPAGAPPGTAPTRLPLRWRRRTPRTRSRPASRSSIRRVSSRASARRAPSRWRLLIAAVWLFWNAVSQGSWNRWPPSLRIGRSYSSGSRPGTVERSRRASDRQSHVQRSSMASASRRLPRGCSASTVHPVMRRTFSSRRDQVTGNRSSPVDRPPSASRARASLQPPALSRWSRYGRTKSAA